MTAERVSVPAGVVSQIRGRWQIPALTWLIRVVLVIAVLGGLVDHPAGRFLAGASVAAIVAAPLLRLAWLVFRWVQEGDRRFVGVGLGVMVVVAGGGVLAALGVG